MAAVDIVVTDENGLPVHCNVAAIRTSDQTIINMYATDSEGKVSVAASGTWYPRPMVSPNYKSRIKLTILNNRHAAVYDYVVDSTGGGTHLTMREMMAAFLAEVGTVGSAIRRSCWLAQNDTDTNIEMSNADINVGLSTLTVEGAGPRRARAAMIFTSVAANDAYFKQTARYSPYLIFKNLRIEGGSSSRDGAFMYHNGGATQSVRNTLFSNCEFELVSSSATNTNPIWRADDNSTGSANQLTFENCTDGGTAGAACANSFARGNSLGPTMLNRLIIRDCEMTVNELSEGDAINTVHLLGGRLTFLTNGFEPDSSTWNSEVIIRGVELTYSGTGTFLIKANATSGETRTIIQSVQYMQTSTAARFINVSGHSSATDRLFMDDVVGRSTAGTAAGPMVTVGASMDTVWVGDVTGWNFTTVVSGATPVGTDHGTLSGLSDDDHSIYLLLLGRAAGQTAIGGTATGNSLTLRSNSFSTPGDGSILFEDANFGVQISSSNPRIYFDGTADRIAYDRTNNRLVVVIGNTEEHRFVTSGFLTLGYIRAGSLSAPGNTTAGDLTAVRAFINNDSNFSLQVVSSNPRLLLDSGDFIEYDRANNYLNIPGARLGVTGVGGVWTVQKAGTGAVQEIRFDFDATADDVLYRMFRLTNTSGARTFTVNKGDGTNTKVFEVRADGDYIESFGAIKADTYIEFNEIATPSTPATGKVRLYPKADGNMYQLTDAGVETNLASGGGGGGAAHNILDGGTQHLDAATDGVSRGSIIYGNSTPAWDEMVLATDRKVLTYDGTDLIQEYVVTVGTYASRPAAATAMVGRLYMATDRANTFYRCKDATTWEVLNPRHVTLRWYLDGRLRADTSVAQGPVRYLPSLDGVTDESIALWKPVRAKAHCRTAPAGAAINLMIEFGTTATPGTDLLSAALSIAAAGNEGTSTSFADTTIENGTAMELLVDQVGSTAGSEGEDLSVEVEFVQQDA